jgi:Enoyl-CoA hydratase/isomerase
MGRTAGAGLTVRITLPPMAPNGAPVVDRTRWVELVRGARDGSGELLGALDGRPLVVVDLDASEGPALPELPEALPCVVVGLTRSGRSEVPPAGLDVALTRAPAPPPPWVTAADLDAAVGELSEAAAASPEASATLVQVLRSGRPDSLGHDLLLESLAYSTLQGGPEFSRWRSARRPRTRRADPGPAVAVERHGPRLSITLNRPDVRNAYGASMRDQLCEALSLACADRSLTDIHLYGGGPDFCSGGDLDEFGTLTDPTTAHLVRTARSAAHLLGVLGERVTAHLHGACVGAGVELPALVHRVVAGPDTWFRLPEVSMGLIPGAGGTATLPRRIGRHRTAWMALTGARVDASTAHAWGLVDEIVDH